MATLTDIARSIRDQAAKRPIGKMTLAECAVSGRIVPFWSNVLQEELVFAADNARVSETEERVVYSARELAIIYDHGHGVAPDALRLLHETKKQFGGEIKYDPPAQAERVRLSLNI